MTITLTEKEISTIVKNTTKSFIKDFIKENPNYLELDKATRQDILDEQMNYTYAEHFWKAFNKTVDNNRGADNIYSECLEIAEEEINNQIMGQGVKLNTRDYLYDDYN